MNNTNLISGKGKGLVWLAQNADELSELCGATVQVPEFEKLGVTFYDDFLNDSFDRLEDRCAELAEQFKGRKVAVRSSAVVSEDSSEHSGAGVYHTEFVDADDLSPDSLANAVLEVYDSVESESAIQYRKEAGLTDERMEVIVQEFTKGLNGVAMSRLPAKAGIIPIWWSYKTGAVVSGDSDAKVNTMYFRPLGKEHIEYSVETIFESDKDQPRKLKFFMEKVMAPLIQRIRERYGLECETEFAVDPDKGLINMLQIRPLTNVTDIEVTFPDKKPILSANLVIGSGEYIGPWVIPERVEQGWEEPTHYAYTASKLDKLQPSIGRGIDYDDLTPNKKAIVLTNSKGPGLHALVIANEKGIISICADKPELTDEEFERARAYTRQNIIDSLGKEKGEAHLQRPDFDVFPTSEYVHVVADGLTGFVYQATREEAEAFNKRLASHTNYEISHLEESGSDEFWDVSFTVNPSDPNIREAICRDFIDYIQQVSGKEFQVKGSYCHPDLMHPSCELEVYGAGFDPNDPLDGIRITTARSHEQIADFETTKQWFQGFIDRVQSPGYNPTK